MIDFVLVERFDGSPTGNASANVERVETDP